MGGQVDHIFRLVFGSVHDLTLIRLWSLRLAWGVRKVPFLDPLVLGSLSILRFIPESSGAKGLVWHIRVSYGFSENSFISFSNFSKRQRLTISAVREGDPYQLHFGNHSSISEHVVGLKNCLILLQVPLGPRFWIGEGRDYSKT